MSDTSPAGSYPDGTRVTCIVTRVEPFGVFVRLKDAVRITGFVRPRDWSWSKRLFDMADHATPGQEIEAEVIGRRSARKLELSRRRVLPNPFPAFIERHRVGDTVLGQVTLVAQNETGVVVVLEDGVEGFIPRSEIPNTGEEGFGLLSQDWVAGVITGYQREQVRLSIKEHLRHRDREDAARDDSQTALRFHPDLGPSLEDMRLNLELGELAEPVIEAALRERIRRVLVVEDSANVSESLGMVFDHFGFSCDLAGSIDEGLAHLGAAEYDLLILDVNLPSGSGVDLVRRLREEATSAIVFVLTATAAAEWNSIIHTPPNQTTCFFQKPTRVLRLFEQLNHLVEGREASDDRAFSAGFDRRGAPLVHAVGTQAAQTEKIKTCLEELLEATRASSAFVLSFRPGPHFELVAGTFPDLTREVQQELEISPVGDVIKKRQFLAVPDVANQKSRFKHLLNVVPVAAFAGIPLAYSDQAEYGLFLFGEAPHQLLGATEHQLRTSALLIGHYIAEERLDQVIMENQALLLTGFLSDSLLHEIKNELQALADFSAVQGLLGKKHKSDLKSLSATEGRELKRSILGIQAVSKRLDELVVLFRNLAGRQGIETVDLNDSVTRLIETVKPFAEAHNVAVEIDLDRDVPVLRASPKLIDQSLLNLMINGVEQMSDFAGARRKLKVTTCFTESAKLPVSVHVQDNGRGVHQVHHEKIFDLFFTTKKRGTGLGLYLSRFFIEQLGGRLRLERSVMFAGTEFVIELPRRVLSS